MWFLPEAKHQDDENLHTFKVEYKTDLKADFLRYTPSSRMFSIVEGTTTEADADEYIITVTLTDEKGVTSSPDLIVRVKILTLESLIGNSELDKNQKDDQEGTTLQNEK